MRWFNNIAKYTEFFFSRHKMKGNHIIRTNLPNKLVRIDPQLTKQSVFKQKMCSTPLFVMGFRDNYVKC